MNLSDAGRQDADAAAERIAALGSIDAVYTSPLERTRETASRIAKAIGTRARVERGLIECDFGAWTGQKLTELTRLSEWRTIQNAPSTFRFPSGESFVDMQARMIAAVERLVSRHPAGRIVAVSHADPIKAFVAHAAGTHLDQFQRLVISPASVTAILLGAGRPVLLTVNSVGDDLSALHPS